MHFHHIRVRLTKSDGTNKKVILYNTSVIALLEHREKMLVKMIDF